MSRLRKNANRQGYFAALAIIVGSALGLGGVEVVSRALGLAPALPNEYSDFVQDAVLPWKLRPNVVRTLISPTGEFHIHVEHNSLGFRGRDHEIEKPPGVFRIVGIGDSFTYGAGVNEDSTFLARIEASLAARGGGVEAINLGMPRYWPEPEALILEHYGLRYQPDLVIVGVLQNDFIDARLGATYASVSDGYLVTSRARHLGAIGKWLYLNSHLARIVIAQTWLWTQVRREPGARWNEEGPIEPGMEDDEGVWARIHWAHDRMVRLARAAGARIAFVHIPHKGPWDGAAFDMPRRLQRFCASRGCTVIDVLPAAMTHPNPDTLYYPNDGHCTKAGYALVADVIVRELESQGLLPDELRSDEAAVGRNGHMETQAGAQLRRRVASSSHSR